MWIISPGHWKVGTGAKSIIDEVSEARKVVNQLSINLKGKGIAHRIIIDNQSKNAKQNLDYLIAQHQKYKNAKHISIHFNASSKVTEKGMGCEVLYANDVQKQCAIRLSKGISQATGLINRGAKKRNDLRFLNAFPKQGVIIEVCFVNSKTDVYLYKKYFQQLCAKLAQEISKL